MSDDPRGELRRPFLGQLVTLGVQFLLGMAVNLFVNIDPNHPGAHPAEYFSGVARNVVWAIFNGPSILLVLHAVLGLILVLGAVGLIVRAVLSRDRAMTVVTIVGGLAVLGAGFNGGSFLNYHEDFSSMLMASFFAIAAVAYEVGLFISARPVTAAPRP